MLCLFDREGLPLSEKVQAGKDVPEMYELSTLEALHELYVRTTYALVY